jgi:dTDP-4-dehydrorhamnose 3,5-epimerase
MIFTETELPGAFIIEPKRLEDARGFFARIYCSKEFKEHALEESFPQCNISFNKSRGTVRGMHYQSSPYEEVKLVRCTRGAVYDVIVDLRPTSPTHLKWIGVELTEENHKMLYVPKGFGHGYQTLTDASEVFYHVSQFYTPEAEKGLRWNDPAIGIEWRDVGEIFISEKDSNWSEYAP